MTKQELLHKAIKIANKAHKGQTDRYHAPYIAHVLRVSAAGRTLDEKIVGALHDVVEDCPEYNLEYLESVGFPNDILFAVKCLSKMDPEESYSDFILRIEASSLAISVKLNDLRDNMDLARYPDELSSHDFKRLQKYHNAYRYLIAKY
ncbi:phosphohydrolase [Chryseobacterium sp. A301]